MLPFMILGPMSLASTNLLWKILGAKLFLN